MVNRIWIEGKKMRTFKLLLPIILNIALSILYKIFSYNVLEDILPFDFATYIDGREECHFGVGFCSWTFLLVLYLITIIWLMINAEKYLVWDVNVRYIILGGIALLIVDGVWAIHYYNEYLNYLPYWFINEWGDEIVQVIRWMFL